jgi:hypothetical protein
LVYVKFVALRGMAHPICFFFVVVHRTVRSRSQTVQVCGNLDSARKSTKV